MQIYICSDWVRHGFINNVMTTWLELLEGKGNYKFFNLGTYSLRMAILPHSA